MGQEGGGTDPHLWGGRRKEGLIHTYGVEGDRRDRPTLMGQEGERGATHTYGAGGGWRLTRTYGAAPHLWGGRRKEGLTHTYGAGQG